MPLSSMDGTTRQIGRITRMWFKPWS